mmetsp:Transcript_28459/g.80405  ORF Transcript_28459/g.80405 Transcript_28459/m.80405 type:complete len:97 (+) Transcript_28459:69-359(+)
MGQQLSLLPQCESCVRPTSARVGSPTRRAAGGSPSRARGGQSPARLSLSSPDRRELLRPLAGSGKEKGTTRRPSLSCYRSGPEQDVVMQLGAAYSM